MNAWPDIPFKPWADTCAALHLYTQIVGKYRLAHAPWINHSWHAAFYLTARGITTGPIPDGAGTEVSFDFVDHKVIASALDGRQAVMDLQPMTVAAFDKAFKALIADIGGDPNYHGAPNEVADPIPFADDTAARPYDSAAVNRFFIALSLISHVMKEFRTGFLGKASPVHLFWGSFDLAVTRFSGRRAPLHPGGVPALPDPVTQEAYSHEVSSAGFWPGGGPTDFPAFYSYAYPGPEGFSKASIEPASAYWHEGAGEFILPYDEVRLSPDPAATLTAFLQSTYEAAAALANWDRQALERPIGPVGKPPAF